MKKIKYIFAIFAMIFGIGLMVPSAVGAQSVVEDICNTDPNSVLCKKQETDLMGYVKIITNTLLFILGVLSVVMIIYGGITYTISAGDSKQVEKAKGTILYSVIGLIVAILAGAIVNFVLNIF